MYEIILLKTWSEAAGVADPTPANMNVLGIADTRQEAIKRMQAVAVAHRVVDMDTDTVEIVGCSPRYTIRVALGTPKETHYVLYIN